MWVCRWSLDSTEWKSSHSSCRKIISLVIWANECAKVLHLLFVFNVQLFMCCDSTMYFVLRMFFGVHNKPYQAFQFEQWCFILVECEMVAFRPISNSIHTQNSLQCMHGLDMAYSVCLSRIWFVLLDDGHDGVVICFMFKCPLNFQ